MALTPTLEASQSSPLVEANGAINATSFLNKPIRQSPDAEPLLATMCALITKVELAEVGVTVKASPVSVHDILVGVVIINCVLRVVPYAFAILPPLLPVGKSAQVHVPERSLMV